MEKKNSAVKTFVKRWVTPYTIFSVEYLIFFAVMVVRYWGVYKIDNGDLVFKLAWPDGRIDISGFDIRLSGVATIGIIFPLVGMYRFREKEKDKYRCSTPERRRIAKISFAVMWAVFIIIRLQSRAMPYAYIWEFVSTAWFSVYVLFLQALLGAPNSKYS